MENRIQLSESEIIMGFVASCIEDVADVLGVDYLEVYDIVEGGVANDRVIDTVE